MFLRYLSLFPIAGLVVATPGSAADEKRLHYLVSDARFSESLPGINLGLRNQSTIKTVAERKLTVTGNEPDFVVRGVVACRAGAKLTKVQAVAGSVVNNNGMIYVMSNWGASPQITTYGGQQSAQVAIPLKIKVSRTYAGEAVDLTFNPARHFEKKLTAFVNGGGSAAQYLHVDEVFHMDVPIILIAWCKMENKDSAFYGQESGGYVRRDIAASILFNGDPAIVDGVGVIAATKATGATIAAPQPPQTDERPIRATPEQQPPARRAGD
jgi:hypothetical protein